MKRYIRSSISDMSVEERISLAQSSKDTKILAELADDEHEWVRQNVAERTHDPAILAKLADDEDEMVRREVVRRTDDPAIVAKLADDADWGVRRAVAKYTDDPAILAKLADDAFWDVRRAVAECTDDPMLLAKLADDENKWVRLEVAERTDDSKILAKLADDEYITVRQTAAKRLGKSVNSKKGKNGTSDSWPSSDWWYGLDDEQFEDAYIEYLSGPEDEVNGELQIFPEPSVQGGMGGLYVFDESGENRNQDDDWYVDWQDYLDWQVDAAATSKNASQYKKKYRKFMKDLCGI